METSTTTTPALSDSVTEGIRVRVSTKYLPERSDPSRGIWIYAYTIRISNEGDQPAKLVSRHWTITNNWGAAQEVKGPGVVGQQPRLEPGEEFEYTSFCPLTTPSGSMRGTYQMVRDSGEQFDAVVGTFYLSQPGLLN